MRIARPLALTAALAALATVGALVAFVLLSTIGGAPADDPVGRLRPIASGVTVTTAPVPRTRTTPTTTTTSTAETATTPPAPVATTTDDDDDHGRGRGRDDDD